MFNDLNRCELIGNITNDLELRYTPNGAAVVSFGVATNRRYKQGDEWKDETNFHNVVVWGRPAESLVKFARKGTRLYVSGRMQTRTWDDKDGKKNYRTELVADEVSLLARYEKSADGAASASSNSSSDASSDQEINPEDLPF